MNNIRFLFIFRDDRAKLAENCFPALVFRKMVQMIPDSMQAFEDCWWKYTRSAFRSPMKSTGLCLKGKASTEKNIVRLFPSRAEWTDMGLFGSALAQTWARSQGNPLPLAVVSPGEYPNSQ